MSLNNKKTTNNKSKAKNRSKKNNRKTEEKDLKGLYYLTFLTAVLVIVATYAWFSASLNVKIRFIEMRVDSNKGLFISLDGIEFSEIVTIDMNSIITDLKRTYPNHTNQWARMGLWPVSSNGIKNSNSDKFAVYHGEMLRTKKINKFGSIKRIINTTLADESKPQDMNQFISFDIFLKNITDSPYSDNLYFGPETFIDYEGEVKEEVREEMDGLVNSLRVGIVQIGILPIESDVRSIQNISCNNNCNMVIYEPFSTIHTDYSITNAAKNGITLINGRYTPTYGVIKEGNLLQQENGHEGTDIPLDREHFALQRTVTKTNEAIFQIPHGTGKYRVYIWIEGQDVDSLEATSKGVDLTVMIDLVKDLASYE